MFSLAVKLKAQENNIIIKALCKEEAIMFEIMLISTTVYCFPSRILRKIMQKAMNNAETITNRCMKM